MKRIVGVNYKEIDFEVYCDYQEAEPSENGTGNQYPATFSIEKVMHGGDDLHDLFSVEQIEEVESLVFEQWQNLEKCIE